MRCLALTLLVAGAAGAQTRVMVAPGSSCDESLRRELGKLAGTQLVEADTEVKASLDAKPPGWRLRVERAGAETLERKLDARDCAEAAFAAAVVVERFLHQLEHERPRSDAPPALRAPSPVPVEGEHGGPSPRRGEVPRSGGGASNPSPAVTPTPEIPAPPPVEPTPAPAPAPAPEPTRTEPNVVVATEPPAEPPAPEPAPPTTVQSPPAAPPSAPLLSLSRWEIAVNAAGWAPAQSGTRFAFGVDAGLLFTPAWRATLELAASLPEETVIIYNGFTRGTLSVEAFNAIVTAGRCIDRELRPCLALAGGVRLARGATSGDTIFHQSPQWLARPSFGLSLSLVYLPWKWLLAGVELLGLVNPVAGQFEVQGIPAATQQLPTFEGLLRVSFGASFNR